MLGVANSIAAIVVVFGLCLLCHELGHFALAKLFNMQVDEFAFGFGRALWQRRRGETTYRLNLLPYGAYVKIAGMEPGSPSMERGFHSRARWQGALVILGGSMANLVLAVVLFTGVTLWNGLPDLADRGIYVGKVMPGTPAAAAGMKAGDRVLAVDGQTRSLSVTAVAPGSPAEKAGMRSGDYIDRVAAQQVCLPIDLLRVLRQTNEGQVQVAVIDYSIADISEQQRLLTLDLPSGLRKSVANEDADGLMDSLGLQLDELDQLSLVGYIAGRVAKPVTLLVSRDGRDVEMTMVTATTNDRQPLRNDEGMLYSEIRPIGRIGVVLRSATRPATPVEAIKAGAANAVASVATVVVSVRLMIRREVAAELAGPVAIMAISADRAKIGWDAVLRWGGMISAILAVVNLFPIPPFDGFRFLLLGYEAVIRRRIDARKEFVLSLAGFAVVVFAFLALTFKDVSNLVRYGTP